MRNTALAQGSARFGGRSVSAPEPSQGKSVPAPIGGWDAFNPIAAMPPVNALQLINWFPQPGWVELRRGQQNHCDTGTGTPVESVMGYMGQDTSLDILIAASGGSLFDVTASTPSTLGTGFLSDRWQFVDYAGTGGSFLWMCNGADTPRYWDGTTLNTAVITVGAGSDSFTPADMINVTVYRDRLWTVIKDSTTAVYLNVDSVQGDGFTFDVGNQFVNGGYLQAIGTWSTDTNDGPNEFISFISSQGDVAIYLITDPTTANGISFRGRSEISQPVGTRCLCKIGSDLGVITLDGVLPLSQVLTYDKAALIGASITKNIRQAITESVRLAKDNFGWTLHSYPRNTMAILNVPLSEHDGQEQYVMNTITGAWGRFQGQYANCWEVFHDLPFYGDNLGIVHVADSGSGDENQILSADLQGAFNYFGERGREKNWTTIRPNITIDQTFPVQPQMGINVDFGTDGTLDPIVFGNGTALPLWDSAIWDEAMWSGVSTETNWAGVNGLGYCASVRITVDIPWTTDLVADKPLKINGFDYLLFAGGFI